MCTLVCLVGFVPTLASDAKPEKPDSRAIAKPREVTFTTAVVPARAKSGATVTYTVTAKLVRPWYIYAYAERQPVDGPLYTRFDFFDTAGLKLVGGWRASKRPKMKRELAFPQLGKVAFYDDEVSWSVPLDIPAELTPGKKSLRCQIYFQACENKLCRSPVRSTLPSPEFTVISERSEH